MKTSLFAILGAALIASGCASMQGGDAIPGVLASGARVELVREGFTFTEGPLADAGGALYFSDIGQNRVHRLEANGKISVVRENSNGTNGLAFKRSGELVSAEGAGQRISRLALDGKATELTGNDGARPLMSPNDLIADAKGGLYFTDPGPRPVVPGRPAYVYYLPPGAAKAVVLDSTIARPNGLTLTLDGKTLIVDDTLGPTLFAFDVQPDGTVRNKRPFIQLKDIPPGGESGADGLAIDHDGRFFISTVTGVQVFDKSGAYLGNIKVARRPANVAFGGPGKSTLYITAREGLYRVQTLTRGPDRLGK